jgi:HD-GYP domain-containing protein (c-di-GMP phosphodiesterase class II)
MCGFNAGPSGSSNVTDGSHESRNRMTPADRVPITRGNSMRNYLMPIFVAAALALAGCNKSKSPEDVSKDVAKAEQKANNEVTKSEEHAQRALDKSYEKINNQEIKFNNDAARQAYNVAIAKADGNRKVALATCESQSGDAQKACKDQAEADYKTARADARVSAEAAVEKK